jgi:hypothetical protein
LKKIGPADDAFFLIQGTMRMHKESLVPALVALQFVAFGWRLNREITVGDNHRKTWLPLPDCLNLLSLVAIVVFCIIAPLARGLFGKAATTILSIGYSLIMFHPISEAAHYRLFSKEGRAIYLRTPDGDYPWITEQEMVSVLLSVVVASVAGCTAWHSSP